MSGKKYSIFLTVTLIIIIVAIVGLLGYLIFNQIQKNSSTQEASDFVDSFADSSAIADTTNSAEGVDIAPIDSSSNSTNNEVVEQPIENTTDSNQNTTTNPSKTNTTTSTVTKKKVMYKGYETVGTIEIPKTKAKYPILAKLSAKSLDTAPVAIYPREIDFSKPGNIVISGHNYRNGTFFSNNKQLSNGDKIYITDLEGNKITYVIYSKYETSQTDTSRYNRDTNGKREITLSTCVDAANDQRLIIEAREE